MDSVIDSFFQLTPERVLAAVEVGGRRATGYALALNSLENRVYEVELEDETRVVAKFYRPGRWSKEAIRDEHRFLAELADAELPVVPPLALDGSATLGDLAAGDGTIHYALFPRVRGRAPDELSDEQLARLGRLIARVHHCGAMHDAPARPTLDPETYGAASLRVLLGGSFIPDELRPRIGAVGERLVESCRRAWASVRMRPIRLHGDCHLGNLLWTSSGPTLVDFDDFLAGPPVQDLWLLASAPDDEGRRQREIVAGAYEELRAFDRASLRLVEPLRALRVLRYAAWIAHRWQDPAFQRAFPDFPTHGHWQREWQFLEEQAERVDAELAR